MLLVNVTNSMLHILSHSYFPMFQIVLSMKVCHTRWTSWSSLRSPNWLSSQQTGLGTFFTWLALHWITQAMNKVEKMLMEVERRAEMMQVARKARMARPVLWRKQDLRMKNCIFVCIYILPPKHRRIHTLIHQYLRVQPRYLRSETLLQENVWIHFLWRKLGKLSIIPLQRAAIEQSAPCKI